MMQRLPENLRAHIRKHEPFWSPQLMGYYTDGGTYIIASSDMANDDGEAHDLFAILPELQKQVLALRE